MEDLIRIIVEDNRLRNMSDSMFKLKDKESHYLRKVMRIKLQQEIYIVNGLGSLWKGKIVDNHFIKITETEKPLLFKEKKELLLGIAIAIPKNGFEDILKMSTELGIDLIQPLITDRQIKKESNLSRKLQRWNSIINESVEQSERLWRPEVLRSMSIFDWISSFIEKDSISISVTRDKKSMRLRKWLNTPEVLAIQRGIIWNVVGPEGGWSKKELNYFIENKLQLVKISENILRTNTAAINASSIMNQWRSDKMKIVNK